MCRKSWSWAVILGMPLLVVVSVAGCRPQTLASLWCAPSAVGQEQPDWWNLSAYRVKDFPGRIIIANDSGHVYVGFYSPGRRFARRLKGAGLTVWLSNPDDRSQRVGVHYPTGMQDRDTTFHANRFLPRANLPPTEMEALFELEHDNVEILRDDSASGVRKLRAEAESLGVQVQLAEVDSAVEYTLTIHTAQLAPWLRPGSKMLLEIESAAMKRPQFEGRRSPEGREWGRGEMPPSGGGGGFPGGGRRGGEHRRPSDRENADEGAIPSDKPIHLSFLIDLASKPVS
jgi:hypothetical protein